MFSDHLTIAFNFPTVYDANRQVLGGSPAAGGGDRS
jgi:hypothetical protein